MKNTLIHSTEQLYHELIDEHERSLQTIEKLQAKIDEQRKSMAIPSELLQSIIIPGNNYIQTTYLDISSIQQIHNGISIKLTDMTTTFVEDSFQKYQEQLPFLYFKPISKSCIVNLHNVRRRIDDTIVMKNGDKFTLEAEFADSITIM